MKNPIVSITFAAVTAALFSPIVLAEKINALGAAEGQVDIVAIYGWSTHYRPT